MTPKKMLPADKARCPGIGCNAGETLWPQCQNCLRRMSQPHERQAWMLPGDSAFFGACKERMPHD